MFSNAGRLVSRQGIVAVVDAEPKLIVRDVEEVGRHRAHRCDNIRTCPDALAIFIFEPEVDISSARQLRNPLHHAQRNKLNLQALLGLRTAPPWRPTTQFEADRDIAQPLKTFHIMS